MRWVSERLKWYYHNDLLQRRHRKRFRPGFPSSETSKYSMMFRSGIKKWRNINKIVPLIDLLTIVAFIMKKNSCLRFLIFVGKHICTNLTNFPGKWLCWAVISNTRNRLWEKGNLDPPLHPLWSCNPEGPHTDCCHIRPAKASLFALSWHIWLEFGPRK